jgi:hypothetical protein
MPLKDGPKDVASCGEISKDVNNILVFSVKEFKKHRYADIRRYFRNGRGIMIPTQSGISISRRHIDDAITFMKYMRSVLYGEEAP